MTTPTAGRSTARVHRRRAGRIRSTVHRLLDRIPAAAGSAGGDPRYAVGGPGAWERTAALLLAAACLGCGRDLAELRPRLGLCPVCRGRLAALRGPRCATCATPVEAAAPPPGYACGRCRAAPPAYERLLAAWSFRPPVAEVVRAMKFRRLEFLGGQLGREVARELEARLPGARPGRRPGDHDPHAAPLVVPVPLHWRRRLARGFDQAEAIARGFAAELGLSFERRLRRHRPTRAQSGLDRAVRRRNLDGAFTARGDGALGGRGILLVDDVVTTTSTARAAARALAAAGAGPITVVAAALTPEEARPG